MNNTSPTRYDKFDFRYDKFTKEITFTVLALAATVTTVAFVVFSAPPLVIVGGVVVTAIFAGLVINSFVKDHLFVNHPTSTPISKHHVRKIPVPENAILPNTIASAPLIVPKKPDFKASIDILPTPSGPIGKPSQRQLIPEYLKKICAENGNPLMTKEDDLLLEFELSDCTYKKLPNGNRWLPAELFFGKEYGDFIRFQCDSKMIELKITSKGSQDSFKKTFQAFIATAHNVPIFEIYDPNAWYDLGEKGSIYKLDAASISGIPGTQVREVGADQFRQTKSRTETEGEVWCDGTKITFFAYFPGFKLSDLDIIINKNYFIIYGVSSLRRIKQEKFFKIKWKGFHYFSFYTLEKIKDKILNATFVIKKGRLRIEMS